VRHDPTMPGISAPQEIGRAIRVMRLAIPAQFLVSVPTRDKLKDAAPSDNAHKRTNESN
jgi:hypothetical protein